MQKHRDVIPFNLDLRSKDVESDDVDLLLELLQHSGKEMLVKMSLASITACREKLETESDPEAVLHIQGQVVAYRQVLNVLINGPAFASHSEEVDVESVVRYTDGDENRRRAYARKSLKDRIKPNELVSDNEEPTAEERGGY